MVRLLPRDRPDDADRPGHAALLRDRRPRRPELRARSCRPTAPWPTSTSRSMRTRSSARWRCRRSHELAVDWFGGDGLRRAARRGRPRHVPGARARADGRAASWFDRRVGQRPSSLTGPALVFGAAVSVQVGAAFAKSLFDEVGPPAVVLMRLAFGAVAVWLLYRPRFARPHRRGDAPRDRPRGRAGLHEQHVLRGARPDPARRRGHDRVPRPARRRGRSRPAGGSTSSGSRSPAAGSRCSPTRTGTSTSRASCSPASQRSSGASTSCSACGWGGSGRARAASESRWSSARC